MTDIQKSLSEAVTKLNIVIPKNEKKPETEEERKAREEQERIKSNDTGKGTK